MHKIPKCQFSACIWATASLQNQPAGFKTGYPALKQVSCLKLYITYAGKHQMRISNLWYVNPLSFSEDFNYIHTPRLFVVVYQDVFYTVNSAHDIHLLFFTFVCR